MIAQILKQYIVKGKKLKFGFLTDKKKIICQYFKISPLPDINDTLIEFYEKYNVSKGWIYGPEVELSKNFMEQKKFKLRGPVKCANYHRLKPTHEITTSTLNDEHLRFLVLGYGFLQGIYLIPEGNLYLTRTAYEPGKLNGLVLSGDDYVNGMEQLHRFYLKASTRDRKQAFAILHWFLIGQSHEFPWEIFDSQYKVLDGIYKLSKVDEKYHAPRPVKLAEKYGVIIPSWAELNESKNKSKLSILRNELVHEAKYAGEPIGYAHTEDNYTLEFASFNTKLICAILGLKTPYIKMNPDCRQICGWDIAK